MFHVLPPSLLHGRRAGNEDAVLPRHGGQMPPCLGSREHPNPGTPGHPGIRSSWSRRRRAAPGVPPDPPAAGSPRPRPASRRGGPGNTPHAGSARTPGLQGKGTRGRPRPKRGAHRPLQGPGHPPGPLPAAGQRTRGGAAPRPQETSSGRIHGRECSRGRRRGPHAGAKEARAPPAEAPRERG